jgi:hypothetical protein
MWPQQRVLLHPFLCIPSSASRFDLRSNLGQLQSPSSFMSSSPRPASTAF